MDEEKINMIKIILRLSIAIPLIIIIIMVWSYFLILSTIPQYLPTDDLTAGLTWNPSALFCNTEGSGRLAGEAATSLGVGLLELISPVDVDYISTDLSQEDPFNICQDDQTQYICGDLSDSIGSGQNGSGICMRGQTFDSIKSFCYTDDMTEGETMDNLKSICCSEIDYEDTLSWFNFLVYFIVTVPLLYLMIEKIFEVFIRYEDGRVNYSSQYKDFFTYISKIGTNVLFYGLLIYFILLPIFRFFVVSTKCDTLEYEGSSTCGITCSEDSDCASLHGGCSFCHMDGANGTCRDPDFIDGLDDVELSDIHVTACVPEDYKFLNGQQIVLNDTNTPFQTTIGRYNLYNSFFIPGEITSEPSCGDNHEIECKLDIDCIWNEGVQTCDNFECPADYSLVDLGTMDGVFTHQDTNSELSIGDRTYLSGKNDSDDNQFPCSNIVIDSDIKTILSESVSQTSIVSGIAPEILDDVSTFELNRIECGDQNSRCYMDNYICETSSGVAIPLKNELHQTDYLSITEFTNDGCKNARLPCTTDDGEECKYIIEQSDGYITEGNDGTCIVNSDGNERCEPPGSMDETFSTAVYNSPEMSECKMIDRYPQIDTEVEDILFRWVPDTIGYGVCQDLPTNTCQGNSVLASGLVLYDIDLGSTEKRDRCCVSPIIDSENSDIEYVVESDYDVTNAPIIDDVSPDIRN